MRIFDVSQPVAGNRVVIPMPMRAALGWHAGARLFCWGQATESNDAPSVPHNQISISAWEPNVRDLWHLSGRFKDRPGMLTEITYLLRELQIDIVTCRASTQLQNAEFALDMEVDTRAYRSVYDLSSSERKRSPGRGLPELHARLVATFINEIVFLPDGTPILQISPNWILNSSMYAQEFRFDAELQSKGLLELPGAILEGIERNFNERYPLIKTAAGAANPFALFTADLRWGVVDATLYYRNCGYMHLRLDARDRLGTLEAITGELKGHGFNLLQLYSRAIPSSGRGIFDIFLHLEDDRINDDEKLTQYIKGTLRGAALKEFDPVVTFPKPRSFMET